MPVAAVRCSAIFPPSCARVTDSLSGRIENLRAEHHAATLSPETCRQPSPSAMLALGKYAGLIDSTSKPSNHASLKMIDSANARFAESRGYRRLTTLDARGPSGELGLFGHRENVRRRSA